MDSSRNTLEGLDLALTDATAGAPGIDGIDVRSLAGAATTIGAIDSAIHSINSARGSFGATRNALVSRYSTLRDSSTRLSATESRIRNADLAIETASRARVGILQDVDAALQAHQRIASEQALQLLRS